MTANLPFRATVFLRIPEGASPLNLIERAFAREADAVTWCRVMTEAQPSASGVWFVAASQGGRTMTLVRESGIELAVNALTPRPALPLLAAVSELSPAEVRQLSDVVDGADGEDAADEKMVLHVLSAADCDAALAVSA